MDDLAGKTLKGYELHERIGTGGFGAVYRAYQPAVGREVAIKVILPTYANHPDFIRRFETEAQLIARLEHPFIVPLFDYWREPDGAYLVMRWIRGGNLSSLLRQAPLPLETIALLIDQVAGALMVAHRRGVIHRDIKPDNILLDEDRNAYLSDFGIAKDLEMIQNSNEPDMFTGSPAYTAPEQIKGETLSPQSDIYSLGVVLYEMLTGKHPFPDVEIGRLVYLQLMENLPPLQKHSSGLPVEIDEVIQKATAKNPEDRHEDTVAFSKAFRRALQKSAQAGSNYVTEGNADRVKFQTTDIAVALPEPDNPYKGLRAFDEADAADFFGRETLISHLIDQLAPVEQNPEARFLAVVGPSGSGKSSLVRAGLMPALRNGALPNSDHWYYAEIIPGDDPLQELEAALLAIAIDPPKNLKEQIIEDEHGLGRAIDRCLPHDNSEFFLLIDQFEEIFTLSDAEQSRLHLLKCLQTAALMPNSRLRLVITLRADFYHLPLLYPDFGELLRRRTEVVLPLSLEELTRAIVAPAERVGVMLEAGLAAAIVHDVGDQAGALPLMQYALTELFERRDKRRLTLAVYEQIGGVLGALARRAEELYQDLSEDEKETARQMFMRLVNLGEGIEDTRRRVARDELISISDSATQMQAVIYAFGKYRLLTFDHEPITRQPTVEVAHEALIRQWGRLREWLTSSREDLRLQRRLTLATEEWLNAGRDPSFLARGARLDQFEQWAQTAKLALTRDESDFLQTSIQARVTQQAEAEAQRLRERELERRARTRLRLVVVVLLIATIMALGLTIFALNQEQSAKNNAATAMVAEDNALVQANIAQTQAAIAAANATEAQSLALAAGAQLALQDGNTDLAAALGLAANRAVSPLQSQLALMEVAYSAGTWRRIELETGITSVAISPDGRTMISGLRDNTIVLWNVETGTALQTFAGHTDRVVAVAFSPDGRRIASASWDNTARLWDIPSGAEIQVFEGHTDNVLSVAFSPDGNTIITGSNDNSARQWDIESGEMLRFFQGHTAPVHSVAFSPDGRRIVSGSADNTIRVWEVRNASQIRLLEGHTDRVNSVIFSHDGDQILSASSDNTVRLWNVALSEEVRVFEGHTDRVTSAAFTPDDEMALSASWDQSLILWDVSTGEALERFTGHTDALSSLAVSTDGRLAISGSSDDTLRVWELNSAAQEAILQEQRRAITAIAFSPDKHFALSGSEDNSIIRWNIPASSPQHNSIQRFGTHSDAVTSLAISADGQFALSGSEDRTMRLWNTDTGAELRRFIGHADTVSSVAFNPQGSTALSGSWDSQLILWDLFSGSIIRRFVGGHEDRVLAVAISPDGKMGISGSNDGSMVLWDLETGQQIRRVFGITSAVHQLAFLPDGKTFISALGDDTLRLWDVTTGFELRRFEGHRADVLALAISGNTLISGSADNSLIIWDIPSGAAIRRLEGHTGAVNALAFSPDGLSAVSAGGDATVRLWRIIPLNALVEWVSANRYVPELTCDQRDLYNIEPLCRIGSN